MKNRKTTIILLISFFVGLSVLLYPTVSSYWNSKRQSKMVVNYEAMLAAIKEEDVSHFFEEAKESNER